MYRGVPHHIEMFRTWVLTSASLMTTIAATGRAVPAARHAFPCLEMVRVYGQCSLPMGKGFLVLSVFLKQGSEFAARHDVCRAHIQKLMQRSQSVNPLVAHDRVRQIVFLVTWIGSMPGHRE